MSDPYVSTPPDVSTPSANDAVAAPAPQPPLTEVSANPPVRPVKKSGRGGSILLAAAAVVAVAGIAFAAGRLTAPASAAAGNGGGNGGGRFGGFPGGSFAPGGNGGNGGPGGFRNGGAFAGGAGGIDVRGQVMAVSSTSITIKLENGSDVTIPLDAQTTYHQSTSGSATDVAVGSTVVVQPGQANFTPNGSPGPQASGVPGNFGPINFGPATDVTVVTDSGTGTSAAPSPAPSTAP